MVWPGCFGSGIGPGSFMHSVITLGLLPVGIGTLAVMVDGTRPL